MSLLHPWSNEAARAAWITLSPIPHLTGHPMHRVRGSKHEAVVHLQPMTQLLAASPLPHDLPLVHSPPETDGFSVA